MNTTSESPPQQVTVIIETAMTELTIAAIHLRLMIILPCLFLSGMFLCVNQDLKSGWLAYLLPLSFLLFGVYAAKDLLSVVRHSCSFQRRPSQKLN